jgi:hypothetical protein
VNGSDILKDHVPSIVASSLLGLIDPEGEGNLILQNVGNHSPESIVAHPRRLDTLKITL